VKTKMLWVLPFLVAGYWASCSTDGISDVRKYSMREGDVRMGLSGFFASLTALIVIRELLLREQK